MALDRDPNHVFRDFVTAGLPSSGNWNPRKPEIRQLLNEWWQTLIALVADAGGLELPNLLISMTVTGGNENDLVAEANLPIPDGPGVAVFSIVIEEANTGPVTINGKPLLSNTGNPLVAGALASEGIYLFLDDGESYRLLSDYVSSSIVAAAEAAASQAIGASGTAVNAAERAESAAAGVEFPVSFAPQTLSLEQQEQARENIGAVDFTSIPVLVTVGSGGDYPSVNAALAAVSKRFLRQYQSEGLTVEVRLKSGFTMSEQVIVERQDLSWITITSEAASVPATVVASPVRASENDAGSACLFAGRHNAKPPRIGALFRYTSQITNSDIGGIGVYWGSSVEILPGCGVQNSQTGLQVLYGSSAVSSPSGMRSAAAIERGANFEDTSGRAVDVQYGSFVELPRVDVSNSGRSGADAIYINWASRADIRQGKAVGCAAPDYAAIRVRDGSVVCARETDVSGSFGHGYYASHASVLDARAEGSVGALNCAQDGIRAEGACTVDATDIDVSGCGTGIRADGSCLVHAWRANANDSGFEGFLALNGSTINAGLSTANNCSRGYDARSTATINAQEGSANDCSITGLYAYQNSSINFESGNAQRCGIGIDAQRGSRANVTNAVFTGCTTHAIRGNRGSHIEAQGAAARRGGSDNSDDVVVASGSIINKAGGTGGVSQTRNTITAAGIIFG